MKEDNNKRRRKKICRFCADSELIIDYKNQQLLENYVTERAKIVPGRVSGACAFHQRKLTLAIKRARHIALLPYVLTEM